MFRQGLLIVVSGPSGTGKGTVLRLLKEKNDNVRFSVSATTRKPRNGEVDGKSYFFKSAAEFQAMIRNGELIEWDEYCGNYYGTPRNYVNEMRGLGYDVVLEITVDGADRVKNMFPDCISMFILPPSFAELEKRITGRGTEKKDVIAMRMKQAALEVSRLSGYDYVILNDDLNRAVTDINCILKAEKLKVSRNQGILEELGFSTEGPPDSAAGEAECAGRRGREMLSQSQEVDNR